MELLVDAGADLDVRVKGLVWGMGFEWETTIFDVTPISYAQCGLYFQFHRKEQNVYGNIAYLWRKKYGSEMECAMCRTSIWRMRACFRRGCRQRVGGSEGCVDQRCCRDPCTPHQQRTLALRSGLQMTSETRSWRTASEGGPYTRKRNPRADVIRGVRSEKPHPRRGGLQEHCRAD